jgi:hypothetical protein
VTKGRILVVVDDESTRRFLAALLTALGHEGPAAARRRLREHKGLLNKLKKWKVEPASKE